jgi:hypothetical protein
MSTGTTFYTNITAIGHSCAANVVRPGVLNRWRKSTKLGACAHVFLIARLFHRCTGRLRTLHRLKPRPCRLCGEVLVSGAKTMEHFKRLHADSRPFMCGSCGELFYWNVSRRNHERTCDGTLRRSDTSCVQPKAGVCRLCNKPMGSITLHQLHFRVVHPDNKPFACARACGSTVDGTRYPPNSPLNNKLECNLMLRLTSCRPPFFCAISALVTNLYTSRLHVVMNESARVHRS